MTITTDHGLNRLAQSRDQELLRDTADFCYPGPTYEEPEQLIARAVELGRAAGDREIQLILLEWITIYQGKRLAGAAGHYNLYFIGTVQEVQQRLDNLPEPAAG